MNYGELKTNIRNYTEVDNTVLTDAILAVITKNAENRIFRDADSDANRFYDTINTITANRLVSVPSNTILIRYINVKDNSVAPPQQVFLDFRDVSFMAEFYDTPDQGTGIPKYYSNYDATQIILAPTPNAVYELTVAYEKKPTSLTGGDSNTSYVSVNYEDLILYACLAETYGYLKGPSDLLQLYEQSYQRALASYAIEQQGRRRRDEYSDGTIRTRMNSPTPRAE
tara:strand:+ start:3358 stop:4035 length:678 start_codon:yes stop_codon:yes gene_type:complete